MDEQTECMDDGAASAALVAAARARVAAQDSKFSIQALCGETGISREQFLRCFAGKQALLAALLAPEPVPVAAAAIDPWLERRLRVFERALTALEQKAEGQARAMTLALARLEERLGTPVAMIAEAPAPQPEPEIEAAPETGVVAPEPEPESEPMPEPPVSKDEMAAFLETARRAAREAEERRLETPPPRVPLRGFAVAGLAVIVLVGCAMLTFGHAARAPGPEAGGTLRRQVPATGFARLMARADSGDGPAQAALALAYLRGQGVAEDDAAAARWARAASRQGEPSAQYLLGDLYANGEGVKKDSARAVFWFTAAALGGHVKAMHNLAIAYAEGLGTPKDSAEAARWFARAAARGYRDSAFDLGVLYERGDGVAQSLPQALRWYQFAAAAGDAPSAARVAVLRQQLAPDSHNDGSRPW